MNIASALIASTASAQLIAFYNFHNEEKQIIKFTNRATAERRCVALALMLEDIAAMEEAERQESHLSVRSAAVRKTWKDSTVAMKRVTRNAVEVIVRGALHVFASVRAAFDALGLPLVKHIRFRIALKNAGTNVFNHNGVNFKFAIVSE